MITEIPKLMKIQKEVEGVLSMLWLLILQIGKEDMP